MDWASEAIRRHVRMYNWCFGRCLRKKTLSKVQHTVVFWQGQHCSGGTDTSERKKDSRRQQICQSCFMGPDWMKKHWILATTPSHMVQRSFGTLTIITACLNSGYQVPLLHRCQPSRFRRDSTEFYCCVPLSRFVSL